MIDHILHITMDKVWQAAVKKGRYEPESLSQEGFIHCSQPAQILEVANTFYRGQRGLILLVIDPELLTCELKWEPPAEPAPSHAPDGELFPHLYGPLNLEAVESVVPFEPDENGLFSTLPGL